MEGGVGKGCVTPQPETFMDRRTLLTSPSRRPWREPVRTDASRVLTEAESRDLSRRILSLIDADEARVNLSSGWDGNTRYAVNRITTAGDVVGVTASILVRFGRRSATVSTNRFDDDSLRSTIERAVTLARLAPEDPESMPELDPVTFVSGSGWSDATAELSAEPRARVAADAIRRANEGGHEIAGFIEVAAGASSVANSRGLFGYHPSTSVDYSVTARTADGVGSGWAGVSHRDWSSIDAAEMHERALSKAIASREARPLAPGVYPAILEPAAVMDLMSVLPFSLDARRAQEGRSPFSRAGGASAIGEQILDPKITLRSDPIGMGAAPFSGEGLPSVPRTWIQNGVLKRLSYSRFWAEEQGTEPTGFAGSIRMEGEPRTLAQLIAETERAVLVTRFWYVRSLDPRTLLYTGLTRDGTFWVENGRIQYPVNNFRWNDSPLQAFRRVDALTRPMRVSTGYELPAIRVPEFNFASVSEAV